MKKRIRIKDIADKAGVSVGTVDRVLHNRGNVAEEVRKKVVDVMDELGYERNLMASALAYNRNFKIIALLPDYSIDPYWEQPFKGVEAAAKNVLQYGIQIEIILFGLFDPNDFYKKAKDILSENKPNGILFPPIFRQEGQKVLDLCAKNKVEVVLFNTHLEHPHLLSYIGQDSFHSGVLAGRLLNFALKNGENALILNLEKSVTNAEHILEKERGFRYYFSNHQHKELKIQRKDFEDFDSKNKMSAFMHSLMHGPTPPHGIFVTNSRAYKVLDAIQDSFEKPIFMVGFDLIEPNVQHLKTNKLNMLINQNPYKQGYLSVHTLFRKLFLKENPETLQYLPLDIVVMENIQYYTNSPVSQQNLIL